MSETPEQKEKQNIKVTLDTSRTEALVRENEKLKLEKEKPFDLAEKKLEMYQQTGEHRYLDCTSKEQLTELTTALMKETVEQRHGTPSGSAPLNSQQLGQKPQSLFSQKFNSEKEMVDIILEYMHSEDPKKASEGKDAYEQFMRKWIINKRANPTRPESSHNPNTPESLLELDLVQKEGFLTPRNKEDGDLGKLQRQWRLERKRHMEGNNQ